MKDNDIYVNYQGKSLAIVKYIETINFKKLGSPNQTIKLTPGLEKDYKKNFEKMERYSSNGPYIYFYDNLTSKLLKSIIPYEFSSQFTDRNIKIMNYSKLEIIFSVENRIILITKTRTDQQRISHIEQDKNDIYVCLFFDDDELGGNYVLDMLKSVMKTFPNQKLQQQKTYPISGIDYTEAKFASQ